MDAMDMTRRELLAAAAAALATRVAPHDTPGGAPAPTSPQPRTMYGLIGKITATPGDRDRLAAILLEGTGAMPGCLSYVVAADPAEADALWVTEVWETQEHHRASLQLPAVQAAIQKGRPLIAGFSSRAETRPLGGVGLPSAAGK